MQPELQRRYTDMVILFSFYRLYLSEKEKDMKKSIKQEVLLRVALIFLVVIATGVMTVSGMKRIRRFSANTSQASEINALVLTAAKAHYGWVENLCSAVAMGTEFTETFFSVC